MRLLLGGISRAGGVGEIGQYDLHSSGLWNDLQRSSLLTRSIEASTLLILTGFDDHWWHAERHKSDCLAKDAVSDYLAQIQAHIKEDHTAHNTAHLLTGLILQYVLTVAAVWSDVAENATLSAANNAGMGRNITMVSANLLAMSLKRSPLISHDCRGRDGSLLRITIRQGKPMSNERPSGANTDAECVVGSGDVCGAVNLNMRFEEHVRERLGHAELEKFKEDKPKYWQMAVNQFEIEPKRRVATADEESTRSLGLARSIMRRYKEDVPEDTTETNLFVSDWHPRWIPHPDHAAIATNFRPGDRLSPAID